VLSLVGTLLDANGIGFEVGHIGSSKMSSGDNFIRNFPKQ
jgi:hypothetical protein